MLAVTYSGSGFGQAGCPAGQHSFTFPWGVNTCVADDAAPPDTSAISADSTPTCAAGQHLFTFPWGVSTCVSDDAPAINVNATSPDQTPQCPAGQHLFTLPSIGLLPPVMQCQPDVVPSSRKFFDVKNPIMWATFAGGAAVVGLGIYAFRSPKPTTVAGRRRRPRRR
jgi:hypothetical protein